MIILGLNTLGIVIETGLGIWIFSKAFPRREQVGCGWKEVVNEAVLHLWFLVIIFANFVKAWPFFVKAGMVLVWILGLAIWRVVVSERQNRPQKYIKIINLIVTVIEFVCMNFILAWNYWDSYVSFLMVWTGNVLLPFFYYKYYRCKLYQAYVWEVLYLATIQIAKCCYMIYTGAERNQTLLLMNRDGGMHTYAATIWPFAIYLVIFLLIKNFTVYDALNKILNEYRGWAFAIAIFESLLLNSFGDLIGGDRIAADTARVITVMTVAMMLAILVLLMVLFKKTMFAEQNILTVKNMAIEQQYQELKKSYELNRCLVHDERHRMQYIEECLENGDIDRAREFVKRANYSTKMSTRKAWTGIATIDFIINTKREAFERLKINFVLQVEIETIPIEEVDFVILLGNLFDNAIEAVEACMPENRTIKLYMNQANNMFFLLLENSNTRIPRKKKDRFLTSKNEKGHGYGIESVKYIIKKYSGEVDFSYDKTTFRVRIIVGM